MNPAPRYAVLVLYLSGDDDFGALHAKNYGLDHLVTGAINGQYPTDIERSEDFNVYHDLWSFPTEQSRSDAIALARACRAHVIDYDGSKHTDAHIVALSDEQYSRYLASRFGSKKVSSSSSSSSGDSDAKKKKKKTKKETTTTRSKKSKPPPK